MKAVLISIRPKWVELIASGKKTVEVRKTRPKLETPFRCYIYCTSGGETLYLVNGVVQPCNSIELDLKHDNMIAGLNGYVAGEFVCDRIESTNCFSGWVCPEKNNIIKRFLDGSCLSEREIVNYADGRAVCGWHISALKMYDEPKKLSEFEKACDHENDCGTCKRFSVNYACINSISRPPQSYMYVEEMTT